MVEAVLTVDKPAPIPKGGTPDWITDTHAEQMAALEKTTAAPPEAQKGFLSTIFAAAQKLSPTNLLSSFTVAVVKEEAKIAKDSLTAAAKDSATSVAKNLSPETDTPILERIGDLIPQNQVTNFVKKVIGGQWDAGKKVVEDGITSSFILGAQSGPSLSNPDFTPLAPKKSFDPKVQAMQTKLEALGYDLEQGHTFKNNGVDGYYGNVTKSVIAQFQQRYAKELNTLGGFKSGVANEATLRLINDKFSELSSDQQRNAEQRVEARQHYSNYASPHTGIESNKIGNAYYNRLAKIESNNNPLARPPISRKTGKRLSSAKGRYQFIDRTGREYGLDPDKFGTKEYTDQEEIAVRQLTSDNHRYLVANLGRNPSAGELYFTHQQGSGGALAILSNPNGDAVSTLQRVLKNNQKGINAVINNGGYVGMTNQEFADKWIKKFEKGYTPDPQSDTQLASVPSTAPGLG